MSGTPQPLASNMFRDTIHFEYDCATLEGNSEIFWRTFSLSHGYFCGFLRDRRMRKNANPDFAATLHRMGNRLTGGFNLARCQFATRHCLETIRPKRQACSSSCRTLTGAAATMLSAPMDFFRFKH